LDFENDVKAKKAKDKLYRRCFSTENDAMAKKAPSSKQ